MRDRGERKMIENKGEIKREREIEKPVNTTIAAQNS